MRLLHSNIEVGLGMLHDLEGIAIRSNEIVLHLRASRETSNQRAYDQLWPTWRGLGSRRQAGMIGAYGESGAAVFPLLSPVTHHSRCLGCILWAVSSW